MSDGEGAARLEAVEDELYGVAPGDFVRHRAEAVRAAKQDGDRELADAIAALRKPSTAAWVLNSFARDDDASIAALIDVGARLRAAVDRGVGDEIRELMRARARAVSDLMGDVRRHADALGEPLSASVAAQVERTLRAAMASEEHARRLRRGVLATALDEPGLGALGAPSRPRPAADRREPDPPAKPSRADRARREAVERRVAAAEDALRGAEAAVAESSARRDALAAEQDELRRRLDEVEDHVREQREQQADAERRLREARSELRSARADLHREE